MAHLINPLATTSQLSIASQYPNFESIIYSTSKLTQAAGILLRLPQSVAAQAVVVVQRFLVGGGLNGNGELSDISAAALFLTAKISSSPRTLRSISNIYTYLLSPSSSLTTTQAASSNDPRSYYCSESTYARLRSRILHLEGQISLSVGFNIHVSLPHALAITYLQTLDLFTAPTTSAYPSSFAQRVSARTISWLNTALLSPQCLYLTHQPNALAVAAVYLASREEGWGLPELAGEDKGEGAEEEVGWWSIFDVDRETLGFLAVGMMSLQPFVEKEVQRWGMKVLGRKDVDVNIEVETNDGTKEIDEEDEMTMMMDSRAG